MNLNWLKFILLALITLLRAGTLDRRYSHSHQVVHHQCYNQGWNNQRLIHKDATTKDWFVVISKDRAETSLLPLFARKKERELFSFFLPFIYDFLRLCSLYLRVWIGIFFHCSHYVCWAFEVIHSEGRDMHLSDNDAVAVQPLLLWTLELLLWLLQPSSSYFFCSNFRS